MASQAIVAVGVLGVLGIGSRVQEFGVERGWFPAWVGRKAAHLGFGALLLLSWPLYQDVPSARWIAAAPAMFVGVYFSAIGVGWVDADRTVKAGSRTGAPAGLLLGPAFYAGVFVLLTIVFWRSSPVGMAALSFMTLGDAMAEVVGKTTRSPRLPWSPEKSVAGSCAALVFGWVGGVVGLWMLVRTGWLPGPITGYTAPLAWVALVGAAVESLPFPEIDNATATLACAAVGMLVF